MTAVLETEGLGKRYWRRWALQDCTLNIPAGKVVGLVGPNGAGKTTLVHLAVGLVAPSAGTISLLGDQPGTSPADLGRVGFVAQDTPVYARLSVGDHLRMGAWLNPGWDTALARARAGQLGLDPRQRAGSLSGGQRAQLALTLAIANDLNCSSSTSPSPVWTPSPGASSCKASWRSSPTTTSPWCCLPISSPTLNGCATT